MTPRIQEKPTLLPETQPAKQTKASKAVSDTPDFQKLVLESNKQQIETRERVNNNDLSSAESYEDFLQALDRKQKLSEDPKNTLGKDEFLKLFVTQLQNQDPLNPKDGTEMASQLAQFNSLEQMINMNSSLDNLGDTAEKTRTAQFLDSIGREITIDGGKGLYQGGNVAGVQFSSPTTTTQLKVLAKDLSGNIVGQAELPGSAAGRHTLNLEGIELSNGTGNTLQPGTYEFELKAQDMNGQNIQIQMSSKIPITGVSFSEADPGFLTPIGTVGFEQVRKIGNQQATDEKTVAKNPSTQAAANAAKQAAANPSSNVKNTANLKNSANTSSDQPPASTIAAARKAAAQILASQNQKNGS